MEYDMDYSENSPAVSKASKGAKAGVKPLGSSTSHNVQKGKTIEEMYQKKSQLEHILLRPDTYIGSTEKQQSQLWVHDGTKMVFENIAYVPGLYKIFDEILVNAADNKVRDASMDTMKVEIDEANNRISVWNNGDGVPVEVHKEEKVYVPELIFGHLLTSSNYNDTEKKVTGGRNGYGAKLTNIFSTEFIIETADGKRGKKYKQVFSNNMTKKGEPKISACKATDNWTCITFKPDLAKFGMDHLENDVVMLMRKRVYDMAGVLGKTVKVLLNGQRIPVKAFQDYVDLYLGPKDNAVPRLYEKVNDRWEVVISPTEGQFQQVSFVNSICTSKGGTHVNYIVDQVTKVLVEKANKKNKHANVKPFMVKNHLWVFINCAIENPAFDSQTKENLTLKVSSFGSKCELPATYIDKVGKSGVLDNILQYADFKNNKELKKGDGSKRQRLTGLTKLEDANDAGGKNSNMCTLILTEGDSAKTLAISGLSVVGRNHYGVFPLRGKLLNVREASAAQITGNQEIQNIKQILGLQHGKVYEDARQLRYGHLMIMADQDHDGSHIKGLLMNFLHTFYPSLLKIKGFLLEFITPIVKAKKGNQILTFYTMPEYEAWKEGLGGSDSGWSIKYYKGLGTSTPDEAKEYFAELDGHRKSFVWQGNEDGDAIEMAFSKKKIEERKRWLSSCPPGTYLDHSVSEIRYCDFINKELILFSRADLERSIPCMVDGLKPGQRKIMFVCFKRNLTKDLKVAQLAGSVAELSAYHHGDQSMAATIVGLAQDFVGSNNINLLVPSGQFGTRLQGGKDHASPRYIYTRLAPITRHLFNESDDKLLKYLNEEGQSIEPEWYMPILPTVLINGAEGIGTGWSTFIPNYNPRDIVDNLKRLMQGEEMVTMQPWYRGFLGNINEVPSKTMGKSYVCSGILTERDATSLEITELPVRKWTQDYKEFLESLVKPEDKNDEPLLIDYEQHHTDVSVHFILQMSESKVAQVRADGYENKFKLTNKLSTGNMMLFNKDGIIQRYDSPEHIIRDFYEIRLEYYEKRRMFLLQTAQTEMRKINNKVRFILAVISGDLVVSNRKKAAIEQDLERMGFDKFPKGKKLVAPTEVDADDEDEVTRISYDYLLSMPIWSLTFERVQQLQEDQRTQEREVRRLSDTRPKDMWMDDLDNFLTALEKWEKEEAIRADKLIAQQLKAKNGGKGRKAVKAAAPRKKAVAKAASDVSDADDSGSDEDFTVGSKATKAAARKPPAAPKAAAPSKPTYNAPVAAAAKKPAAARGKAKAAAVAAAEPSMSMATAQPAASVQSAGLGSLAERIKGRLTLADAPGSSRLGPNRAGSSDPDMEYLMLDSESDAEAGDELTSPAPAVLVQKVKAAAKPRARAAAAPAARGVKPAAKPAAAKAPPKRKGKLVVESSSEEESVVVDSESEEEDIVELDHPSPAVAPKAKIQRQRPSPFHKGSGAPKAAAPAAVAGRPAAVQEEAGEEEQEDSPQVARARAGRRAAPVTYVIADTDEEDGSEEEEASDVDSDYAESD